MAAGTRPGYGAVDIPRDRARHFSDRLCPGVDIDHDVTCHMLLQL